MIDSFKWTFSTIFSSLTKVRFILICACSHKCESMSILLYTQAAIFMALNPIWVWGYICRCPICICINGIYPPMGTYQWSLTYNTFNIMVHQGFSLSSIIEDHHHSPPHHHLSPLLIRRCHHRPALFIYNSACVTWGRSQSHVLATWTLVLCPAEKKTLHNCYCWVSVWICECRCAKYGVL